jgi:hypothetical protein
MATPPIQHWSYSSLTTFLRNPLSWYKRYVEGVYDTPTTPSSVIGRAGHTALEHFYNGRSKVDALAEGLKYLRDIPDFEINFGKATSIRTRKQKRKRMERDYNQAISFYLKKPPRYQVLGVEVKAVAEVEGLALPIKAVSDLVVKSKVDSDALDIVDHKFVNFFSPQKSYKTLFIIQAIFNYYVIGQMYEKPVRRFIVHECKKSKNADGSPQLRRYVLDFKECAEDFKLFHRLINDATAEISRKRHYLPNPSDMFEGENSVDIYRLGLAED